MKILVIEDNPEIIESLIMVFQLRWPEASVLTTNSGEKGVELARNESPNIIILDLGLPDIDGLQVLRRVREFTNIPVIILTVRGDEIYKMRGLELGADDYMVKPFSPGELLARVKTVTRRFEATGANSEGAQKPFLLGKLRVDSASNEVVIDGKPLRLSPREKDILYKLVEHRGEFVPIETLMKAAAAPGEQVAESLVTFSLKMINEELGKKLGIDEAIISEYGKGYKLVIP